MSKKEDMKVFTKIKFFMLKQVGADITNLKRLYVSFDKNDLELKCRGAKLELMDGRVFVGKMEERSTLIAKESIIQTEGKIVDEYDEEEPF